MDFGVISPVSAGLSTPSLKNVFHNHPHSTTPPTPVTPNDIQMAPAPQRNTLAAKTASLANPQTLFQQCQETKRRLRHVVGYEKFIDIPNARDFNTMDLVWQSLRLGSSLCHLLNMYLPDDTMPIRFDFPDFDFEGPHGVFSWAQQNVKRCQKPAAHFIMKMKELQRAGKWPESDPLWALHELFSDDTGCLVKVLRTVAMLLDGLPDTAWIHTESPTTPFERPGSAASAHFPTHQSSLSAGSFSLGRDFPIPLNPSRQPLSINTNLAPPHRGPPTAGTVPPPDLDFGPVAIGGAAMHVWEILKTEKKYVQDLEVLHAYSQEVLQQSILTADTVHIMFSNLTKLVDFQRRFLISLETEYEPFVEKGGAAWIEGRWGYPFLKHEKDFAVYEPYCANYMTAIELVEKETPTLSRAQLSLTVSELTSFLVIPIQRLCRYSLLLKELVGSSEKTAYEYKSELTAGWQVTKRIADSVNETLRHHTNIGIVRELADRVKDWKGHDITDFGHLLLDGRFNVTKGDVERDYEVYLFEKMILCCKEIIPEKVKDKRHKSGSILKKQSISGTPVPAKKNLLSLKGRIYVNNLTHIEQESKNGVYTLKIFWRQQENPMEFEHFVLHVKNSEQLQKWEAEISKLMEADASRRAERERRQRQYISPTSNFAVTPAAEQVMQGHTELRRGSNNWEEEGTPSTTVSNKSMRTSDRYSGHSMRNSTEDTILVSQLRYQQGMGVGAPPIPMQRMHSTQSLDPRTKVIRGTSDDSYGPALNIEDPQEILRSTSTQGNAAFYQQAPALRMRSASSPNVYGSGSVQMQPTSSSSTWESQANQYNQYNPSKVSLAAQSDAVVSEFGFKRSSNSSNATEVSEGSTPETPYGTADLLATLPPLPEHIIVKVHYNDVSAVFLISQERFMADVEIFGMLQDIFKLSVSPSIPYKDLLLRVGKKVQMCGGINPGAQIKCYYTDEDGERLRLTGDDDLPYLLEPVLTGLMKEVEIKVKV